MSSIENDTVAFLIEKEASILKEMEKDPLVVASNVYKILDENEKVRVLEVIFKPGDVAKMHHHPNHVVYAKNGGKLNFLSGGKTQDMNVEAGSVLFLDAQDHEAKNIGNTTIDLIVVELKK